MNQRTIIPRRSRGAIAEGIDNPELRQRKSTIKKPVVATVLADHHRGMLPLRAPIVERVHSRHHTVISAEAPATSAGFRVVEQLANAGFQATAAIADNPPGAAAPPGLGGADPLRA